MLEPRLLIKGMLQQGSEVVAKVPGLKLFYSPGVEMHPVASTKKKKGLSLRKALVGRCAIIPAGRVVLQEPDRAVEA